MTEEFKSEVVDFVIAKPLVVDNGTEFYKAELHAAFGEEAPIAITMIDKVIEEIRNEEIREQIFDMATVGAMKIWNETSNLRN